jgi:hypothetical protein
MKIKDEDWNPGYWKSKKDSLIEEFIAYEKSWYCDDNKIIHKSLKEKQNCKYCKE